MGSSQPVTVYFENSPPILRVEEARGVALRMPPKNHSWALEFQVEDPDGNVLRSGSEPKQI